MSKYFRNALIKQKEPTYIGCTLTPTRRRILKKIKSDKRNLEKSNSR